MPLFSWFWKKSSDEDFEQILASLELLVQKRQTKLSEIRLRERRATLLVTTWALVAWLAYGGLWWTGILGQSRGWGMLWGVPVVVGPIIILFTRRIVQLWYARKRNAEEQTLKKLLVQQRNKIEEIKKKTNYYTTKNLLDRYDERSARPNNPEGAPGLHRRGPPAPIQSKSPYSGKPNGSSTPTLGPGQQPPQTPARGGPQGQPFSPPLPPLPPPRKQWYDKLADALLGDDTASTGPSPASRYALICERCFTHNGLVKEDQWEHAQYVCPKCGHFNLSARSRKAGATAPSTPQSAISPSGVPLPFSAMSQGFPSASASASPSSAHGSPPSSFRAQAQREPSPKSPLSESTKPSLSESTVLVEKKDAEDHDRAEGYDVATEGEAADKTMRMEVDS